MHTPISTDSETRYISFGNNCKSPATTGPASMSRNLPSSVRFNCVMSTSDTPVLVTTYVYSISTKQSRFPPQFSKLTSSNEPKESNSVSPSPLQVVSISNRCTVLPSGELTNREILTGSSFPPVTTQISSPVARIFSTKLLPPESLSGDTIIPAVVGRTPKS
jgi:hypothetical protein